MSSNADDPKVDQTASPRQWFRLVVVYLLIPLIYLYAVATSAGGRPGYIPCLSWPLVLVGACGRNGGIPD